MVMHGHHHDAVRQELSIICARAPENPRSGVEIVDAGMTRG
jgi:hypothetical protein